jgi:hypothetical protein
MSSPATGEQTAEPGPDVLGQQPTPPRASAVPHKAARKRSQAATAASAAEPSVVPALAHAQCAAGVDNATDGAEAVSARLLAAAGAGALSQHAVASPAWTGGCGGYVDSDEGTDEEGGGAARLPAGSESDDELRRGPKAVGHAPGQTPGSLHGLQQLNKRTYEPFVKGVGAW